MAFEFKLPDIGEGVVEGEIVKWHVKPGDVVAEDQPMVEVMTDKATVVIPSPKAGKIVETRGKEGDIAKVHSVLVVIEEGGGGKAAAPKAEAAKAEPAKAPAKPAPAPAPAKAAAAPAKAAAAPAKAAPAPAKATSGAAKEAASLPKEPPAKGARPEGSGAEQEPSGGEAGAAPIAARAQERTTEPGRAPAQKPAPRAETPRHNGSHGRAEAAAQEGEGKVLAAPATRRLARELGVDLRGIPGSGPAGRVTSNDVRRALESGGAEEPAAQEDITAEHEAIQEAPREIERAQAPSALAAADERVQVKGIRKRIWENMARSKSHAAHFTFVEECDATALVELRERFNQKVAGDEAKLSYLPFIVKAVIAALRRFPDLNAHVDDETQTFVRRGEYHIGIAAATERGLIVPVIRHADRRSILELASEIKRLGDAARTGKLSPSDLGGSTFTITSLGKEGGIFATPIINYPEVAIMGIHKMARRPVVLDDSDAIVIRSMMNLSLSFDHRLIDGHVGAAFTYAVIHLLQNPDRLLMEMV